MDLNGHIIKYANEVLKQGYTFKELKLTFSSAVQSVSLSSHSTPLSSAFESVPVVLFQY